MARYAKHGRCCFCRNDVEGDRYCHGCKEFVCADCDATQASGPHDKEAHRGPVESDDDEDDDGDRCESCDEPATRTTADDVPMCEDCYEVLCNEQGVTGEKP